MMEMKGVIKSNIFLVGSPHLLLKTNNLLERELLLRQLELECNIDDKIRTEDIANDMGENF